MMMFAILFGLSMDYEVFLLSRVREEYVKSGDNGLAVADGLASTARVITAAAAIMVSVFLSFVLGDDVLVKVIGIGLAAAILIDATIVRMVLVPATMELLGDRNWWLPRWLDRILPDVHVEGEVAAVLAETSDASDDPDTDREARRRLNAHILECQRRGFRHADTRVRRGLPQRPTLEAASSIRSSGCTAATRTWPAPPGPNVSPGVTTIRALGEHAGERPGISAGSGRQR